MELGLKYGNLKKLISRFRDKIATWTEGGDHMIRTIEVSTKNLLVCLNYVLSGAWQEIDGLDNLENKASKLIDDLKAFHRKQVFKGTSAISRAAISKWASGGAPRRIDGLAFIYAYALSIRDEVELIDADRKTVYYKVIAYLQRIMPANALDQAQNAVSDKSSMSRAIFDSIMGITSVSGSSPHSSCAQLFSGSAATQARDYSYYVAYRYSTKNGSILKSFIVVHRETATGREPSTFNHFIWGRDNVSRKNHVYRECEGFILSLDKSFYFVGYNYSISSNKVEDPAGFRRMRDLSKKNPTGMGLISVEYDSIKEGVGLFSGLTMTVGAMGQPVMARIALLHLGTKSGIGAGLSDELFSLGEIQPKSLPSDLAGDLDSIKRQGGNRMGYLHIDLLEETNEKHSACVKMANTIIAMIENRPDSTFESGGANGVRKMDGALETFSPTRGARPRE